nr:macrophage mannose receptor 1-like [Misgurnus anguillicaudatus]
MTETVYFRLLFIALCSLSECIQRHYHHINMNKTWTEAQSYCREHYTDLATVNNMNHMKQLNKSVNKHDVHVWIGLKKTGVYKWKWSLGEHVNYKNWINGNDCNGEDNCAFMRNGEWHHQSCGQKSDFICYNGDKGYIYETSQMTWREAQIFCRQHHTDLVTVSNQNESEQIQKIINNNQISVWIGLFSDSWEWSDKSNSGFRYWMSGQPNGGPNSMCTEVQMNNQGQWNDAGCSNSQTFVCHEDGKLVLINESLSWSDALSYCRQNHVDLVSVDSEEIQRRVSGLVKQASTPEVWLGLRHSCALGVWFWTNGQMVCYQNWVNSTVDKSCDTVRSGAVQSGDQRWISLPQTKQLNFICIRYD